MGRFRKPSKRVVARKEPGFCRKLCISSKTHLGRTACFCLTKMSNPTLGCAEVIRVDDIFKVPAGTAVAKKATPRPAPAAEKVPAAPQPKRAAPVPKPTSAATEPRQVPSVTPKPQRKASMTCAGVLKAVVFTLTLLAAAVGSCSLGADNAASTPCYTSGASVMSYANASVAKDLFEGFNSSLWTSASPAQQHLLADFYDSDSLDFAEIYTNKALFVDSDSVCAWFDAPCDVAAAPAATAAVGAAVPAKFVTAEPPRLPTVTFVAVEAGNFTVLTPQHLGAAQPCPRPITSFLLKLLHQHKHAAHFLVSKLSYTAHDLSFSLIRFSQTLLARVEAWIRLPAANSTIASVSVDTAAAASIYSNATCYNKQFKTYKRPRVFTSAAEKGPAPAVLYAQLKGRSPLLTRVYHFKNTLAARGTSLCRVVVACGARVPSLALAPLRTRLGVSAINVLISLKNNVVEMKDVVIEALVAPVREAKAQRARDAALGRSHTPANRDAALGRSHTPANHDSSPSAALDGRNKDWDVKNQGEKSFVPMGDGHFVPTHDVSVIFLTKFIVACVLAVGPVMALAGLILGNDSETWEEIRHRREWREKHYRSDRPYMSYSSYMSAQRAKPAAPAASAKTAALVPSPAKKAPPQEPEKETFIPAAAIGVSASAGPVASGSPSLDRQSSLASSVTAAEVSPARAEASSAAAAVTPVSCKTASEAPAATPVAGFDSPGMEEVDLSESATSADGEEEWTDIESPNPFAVLADCCSPAVATIPVLQEGQKELSDEEDYDLI